MLSATFNANYFLPIKATTDSGNFAAGKLKLTHFPFLVHEPAYMQLPFPITPQVFITFFDLATDRAILSNLKMVVNSMFLLIQSFLFMTESVIAPL